MACGRFFVGRAEEVNLPPMPSGRGRLSPGTTPHREAHGQPRAPLLLRMRWPRSTESRPWTGISGLAKCRAAADSSFLRRCVDQWTGRRRQCV